MNRSTENFFHQDPTTGGATSPNSFIQPTKLGSSVGGSAAIVALRSSGVINRAGGNRASCSCTDSRCNGARRDTMYRAAEDPSSKILTRGIGNRPRASVDASDLAAALAPSFAAAAIPRPIHANISEP